MTNAVVLPAWAVWVASIGAPVGAFLGVWIAQWVLRKGARELDDRSRREEVMRNLRWAAELAVSDDPGRADLGVAQLIALSSSDLTDQVVQTFVDAALDAVTDPAADVVEQNLDAEIHQEHPDEPSPLSSSDHRGDVDSGAEGSEGGQT